MNSQLSYSELLRLLSSATEKGRITWEESADPHVYRALLPNGIVKLVSREAGVEIQLLDTESTDLGSYLPDTDEDQGHGIEFYIQIGRRLRQVDEKLEALVGDLRALVQ
jgi:hypothetical protein